MKTTTFATPTMEERELALRAAIEEGLKSGIVEDFDSDAFLQQMKEQKLNLLSRSPVPKDYPEKL